MPVAADEPATQFSAEHLEFFEKEVRPLLVKRCYECHSGKSKTVQGSLRLDSRAAVLAGGDTGEAAVPGQPEESLLIDAINYGNLYEMPPDSKLPAAEIEVLTRWVKLGLPWPDEAVVQAVNPGDAFDLKARRDAHWCWQPIRDITPPRVEGSDWPASPVDQFIWKRLDEANLQPAPPADKRTLIRRAYFDLVGLPPTPEEVAAFVADQSPDAFAKVVDELLRSSHFGERWGRHWLDLVRYAESRGHEFDYDAPNASEYRDYLIRAFNADVPYDQFIREHVAGDLVEDPRLHPTEKFNESILGTGFWFLGEWVHSPVGIRHDEADRFDNMVDVFGKTFLAVTLGCARCHDHKFDAIAQSDYYAMFGYLQSSAYRQARFETMLQNQQAASKLTQLDHHFEPALAALQSHRSQGTVERLPEYLSAASEVMKREGVSLWTEVSNEAVVFADFEDGSYGAWQAEGEAFGSQPQTLQTIASYQGQINAVGQYFINTHNVRSADGVQHGDQFTGTLTSPQFTIQHSFIEFWVGGGSHAGETCVNLLVDGRVVESATGRNNNQMHQHRWDVSRLLGREARIQVVDRATGGWGNIGADHFVFTNGDAPPRKTLSQEGHELIRDVAELRELAPELVANWVEHLTRAQRDDADPFYLYTQLQHLNESDPQRSAAVRDQLRRIAARQTDLNTDGWKLPEGVTKIVDYSQADEVWLTDGPTFGTAPSVPGSLISRTLRGDMQEASQRELVGVSILGAARRDPTWNGLTLAPGTQKDSGRLSNWDRAGKTIRTPTFDIDKRQVFALVRGSGVVFAVVDSHRMINGPLHGGLLKEFDFGVEEAPRWIAVNLTDYQGHNAHLEITAVDQKPLEVLLVVKADSQPDLKLDLGWGLGKTGDMALSEQTVLESYQQRLREALELLKQGGAREQAASVTTAAWADWVLRNRGLLIDPEPPQASETRNWVEVLQREYAKERSEVERTLQFTSRTAMAMWDGNAWDDYLLIRGNPKTEGEKVARRFMLALGGEGPGATEAGSGRLQLANAVADPDNPLTSRVMVNRVWHHLFGRGLVASTDNFGVLGEEPTHPELLDYLARQFTREGWSVKKLIRSIMLSRTYQMSSRSDPESEVKDPENKLLHRAQIRRLEGEAIRDSILAISGRLDPVVEGRSVPVHLTPFMQGRGRPGSGPVDGNGRRSIYISVRRNFLSPMMLAFDTPQPFNTVGRRNVSNVPAQALILMNSPFVYQQAQRWAKRMLEDLPEATLEQRVERLYVEAFARPPRGDELTAARDFLRRQASAYGVLAESDDSDALGPAVDDVRLWTDLCHVLFNVKEFIFLQ